MSSAVLFSLYCLLEILLQYVADYFGLGSCWSIFFIVFVVVVVVLNCFEYNGLIVRKFKLSP